MEKKSSEEIITPTQRSELYQLTKNVIGSLKITEREAEHALKKRDVIASSLRSVILENKVNALARRPSDYGYPTGYSGAKELQEQATVLQEKYQFPLKPLARVESLPEGAEGLWVMPLIKEIVPLGCDNPYNYAADFVAERLESSRKFRIPSEDRFVLKPSWLQQLKRSHDLWSKLVISQGDGKLTPILPAQFGMERRGESVDYSRMDTLRNEFLLGFYHIGVMLLTHPEREQVCHQLHIYCGGDVHGFSFKNEVLTIGWNRNRYGDEIFVGNEWSSVANKFFGSPSGFIS